MYRMLSDIYIYIYYLYTYIYNISIYLPLESTSRIPPYSFLIAMILDDYRDNITSESIRLYLDFPLLFPDCDDIGFICNSGAPRAALAEPHS